MSKTKFEIKKPLPAGHDAQLPAGFDIELPDIAQVNLPDQNGLNEPMPGESKQEHGSRS